MASAVLQTVARSAWILGLFLVVLPLASCRPELDSDKPTLAVPSSLPPFALEPSQAPLRQRADDLVGQGRDLLKKGELKQAVPVLTEALATDPSSPAARLELARTFARGGRASVAVQLLKPAAEKLKTCGGCVELLQAVRQDPDFAHLRETTEGRALLQGVPAEPLPYAKWATEVAQALQGGDAKKIEPFVHSRLPFDLVRSCPSCPNPAVQATSRRPLVGLPLAAKVVARFEPRTQPGSRGTPLLTEGKPICSGGCCSWKVPEPVPVDQAALRRLCFRPGTPTVGHLTEIEVVYGTPALR